MSYAAHRAARDWSRWGVNPCYVCESTDGKTLHWLEDGKERHGNIAPMNSGDCAYYAGTFRVIAEYRNGKQVKP